MSVDFERAVLLMEVIKYSADLGPREANSVTMAALMELREMDAQAKEELAEAARQAQQAAVDQAAEAEAAESEDEEEDDVEMPPPNGTPPTTHTRRL